MYESLLRELLDRVPGARGAVFCDEFGEAVQALGTSGRSAPFEVDDYDLKVAGAQLAEPLDVVGTTVREMGRVRECTIRGERETLLVHTLPDRYYLVLCLAPHASAAVARERMRDVAAKLAREI